MSGRKVVDIICRICSTDLVLNQGYIHVWPEDDQDRKERHEMYCPHCGVKYFIGLNKKEAGRAYKDRFMQ